MGTSSKESHVSNKLALNDLFVNHSDQFTMKNSLLFSFPATHYMLG